MPAARAFRASCRSDYGAGTDHYCSRNKLSSNGLLDMRGGLIPLLQQNGFPMRITLVNALVSLVVTVGLSAPGVMAADADHGAQLAKRWCATCHVVDSDQKQANADVPPFAAIARKPNFTPEKVAFFLLDPHPRMPNFSLSRSEAADIAAYIGSLRK